MPIPILIGAVAVAKTALATKAAIGIGAAVVATGGTAVYMSSQHKEEVSRMQDRIYQLQKELADSREKEKNLQAKIVEIQQEQEKLTREIAELNMKTEEYQEKISAISAELKKNDSRFRRIIATITFRLKQLEEENQRLSNKLEDENREKSLAEDRRSKTSQNLISLKDRKEKLENELGNTCNLILSIESEIKDLKQVI
ncbi:hypothetical protein F8154_08800 [Alkaliphilus pronyensis]|uniref:Uncharacterized protein n=1 Tax=Alkaliphilus pronyensis TaxID=1482732 RepID=A0A6I0EZD5_9FIRM|nr:hypothetical protein [Alkaliphilus pronyensis]KAB3534499.1 hypothetical protein F8154_08800 [Alkaliphilus pronyensis]